MKTPTTARDAACATLEPCLLDRVEPVAGRLVLSSAPSGAGGFSYAALRCLDALRRVRFVLAAARADGLLTRTLWAGECETLADRLDLLIAEFAHADTVSDWLLDQGRAGLALARRVLLLASRTGGTIGPLWAHEDLTLADYIEQQLQEILPGTGEAL